MGEVYKNQVILKSGKKIDYDLLILCHGFDSNKYEFLDSNIRPDNNYDLYKQLYSLRSKNLAFIYNIQQYIYFSILQAEIFIGNIVNNNVPCMKKRLRWYYYNLDEFITPKCNISGKDLLDFYKDENPNIFKKVVKRVSIYNPIISELLEKYCI